MSVDYGSFLSMNSFFYQTLFALTYLDDNTTVVAVVEH
jgi:hypothetical protein